MDEFEQPTTYTENGPIVVIVNGEMYFYNTKSIEQGHIAPEDATWWVMDIFVGYASNQSTIPSIS